MSAGAAANNIMFRAQAIAFTQVRNDDAADVTALTRAMVRGDEAAWVRFHGEYSGRIYRYLLVLLKGDIDTASELMQVTFTRVARHIRKFDDEMVLWHWLARVARTTAVDELRKRGRREESLRELAEAPEPDDGQRWPEVLAQALTHLGSAEAELLRQKYIDGLSVRELAGVAGLSEKATESRLTRAREKLREAMVQILKSET